MAALATTPRRREDHEDHMEREKVRRLQRQLIEAGHTTGRWGTPDTRATPHSQRAGTGGACGASGRNVRYSPRRRTLVPIAANTLQATPTPTATAAPKTPLRPCSLRPLPDGTPRSAERTTSSAATVCSPIPATSAAADTKLKVHAGKKVGPKLPELSQQLTLEITPNSLDALILQELEAFSLEAPPQPQEQPQPRPRPQCSPPGSGSRRRQQRRRKLLVHRQQQCQGGTGARLLDVDLEALSATTTTTPAVSRNALRQIWPTASASTPQLSRKSAVAAAGSGGGCWPVAVPLVQCTRVSGREVCEQDPLCPLPFATTFTLFTFELVLAQGSSSPKRHYVSTKRYSECAAFHGSLSAWLRQFESGGPDLPALPPKRIWPLRGSVVAEREHGLREWLQALATYGSDSPMQSRVLRQLLLDWLLPETQQQHGFAQRSPYCRRRSRH
jgi:hypothetical protein